MKVCTFLITDCTALNNPVNVNVQHFLQLFYACFKYLLKHFLSLLFSLCQSEMM